MRTGVGMRRESGPRSVAGATRPDASISLRDVFNQCIALGACVALLLVAWTEPVRAQMRREIVFTNDCRRPVRILVHHADGYQNWHPHGWYYLPAFTSSTLRDRGVVLTQSDGHDLYYYAEPTDGSSGAWEGNDASVMHEGVRYSLLRANATVRGGSLNVRLTCG
jgi:hypothetical protein